MALLVGRLTALKIQHAKKPGMYADGGGLYMQVTGNGRDHIAKSWIFRFTLRGRCREMGLGSLITYGLADAREKARECRRQLDDGIDPIEARKAKRAEQAAEDGKSLTFKECTKKYIAVQSTAWSNAKHAAQWPSTLKTYAEPIIGHLPIRSVDTQLVMKVLEPIWAAKPETAGRLRGRIEAILDWAAVQGMRSGDNPARWRGHLDKLLPPRARIRTVLHHPALSYRELPDFMTKLRQQDGTASRALEFLILTAARTGEVIAAGPLEIAYKTWTVPAFRMKNRKEHRVPLSPAALALAENQKELHGGEFLFPGGAPGKPLSNMAMLTLLKRMGRDDITPHGFRSTFKDWASEQTGYPSEVTEMALAHTIENQIEAAYRRGDLFNKRIPLMNDWAKFCAGTLKIGSGKVVAMRNRA